MSNSEKEQEDLKKLEDEAYFELLQIIAEAMQLQDIELLDARIASWKSKYKVLLDKPNPQFKKRIEYLLNEYYSKVTLYILDNIHFKEEKTIKNQYKAMQKLYSLIKETNDYQLLKDKIGEWKKNFPVEAFLKMYQNKIKLATTDKNIRRNSFEQDKAFSDLIDITKKKGTFDELTAYIKEWETKYSINDKYELVDFIKNQSEIKRYTSDEYLLSISTQRFEDNKTEVINSSTNTTTIHKQAQACTALLSIVRNPNNLDQIFDWVYKYNSVKFNDFYKGKILANISREYSPTYLSHLSIPDIDFSKSALSLEQYNNMEQIKRYAVISYFNMLLPPEQAFQNNYFNKHIREIYYESEKLKHSNIPNIKTDEMFSSGIEIPLTPSSVTFEDIDIVEYEENSVFPEYSQAIIEEDVSITAPEKPVVEDIRVTEPEEPIVEDIRVTEPEEPIVEDIPVTEPEEPIIEDISVTDNDEKLHARTNTSVSKVVNSSEVIDTDSIQPKFFNAMNYYFEQANLIHRIDNSVTKYINLPTKVNTITKTRNNLE